MALPRQNEISKSGLLAAIRQMNTSGDKQPIKTSAKSTMVRREFVGHTIDLFTGLRYQRIRVTEEMVDRELVECLPAGIKARLSFVSIPARKMRVVAREIKGMPIQKAMDVLNFTKRAAAGHIAKTLKSAAANGISVAGTSHIRPEDLYVQSAQVDEAPTAKRIRFQSMGRVFRYRKRYCHLTIVLEERVAKSAAAHAPGTKAKKADAADATGTDKPKKSASSASTKAPAKKAAVKKTAKKSAAEENQVDDVSELGYKEIFLGQKTHPIGLRLGIIKAWNSRWYAPDRLFADLVHEDMLIKRYINRRLDNAGISNVLIQRQPKKVTVDILTARPGIVIGRRGAEVDKLREELQLLTHKDIALNIVEVRKPELDAKLVADSIARQLEGRVSFRRAMKKSISSSMKMGAEGIKIQCGGRLGGAEIARTEKYMEGRVPLHTLRADIDYATSTAHTTYGTIGVKVWICRGEVLDGGMRQKTEDAKAEAEKMAQMPQGGRPGRGRDDRGPGGGDRDRGHRRPPRGRVRRPEAAGDNRPPRGRRPDAPRGDNRGGGDSGGGSQGEKK